MKRSKRRIVIIIIISLAALLLIASGAYLIVFKIATSKMNPSETGELIPGFLAVNTGYVSFYLIKADGNKKYIAIDAGMGASKAREGLQHLGISADDITAVLLTHAHADHTGALSLFDKAVVYAGGNTESGKVSKKLKDGETTVISGIQVQCIYTPGHTNDSVCYLINNSYLFSGDTLSLQDNQVGMFISLFNKSDETQAADIKRLAALSGVKYVFSAHHGYTDRAVFP